MSRYTNPTPQILDGDGKPIVGAKKFFFTVGTELKKTVYSDSAFGTAIANPVLSDADGRFPPIFLNGLYDEVQQDNSGTPTSYDGVTLWGPLLVGTTAEGPFESWGSDNTYNIPNIVLGSNDEYYRSLVDSNTGNDPISSPGSWEQLQFGRVWNTNITYSEGDTVYGSDGFLYISIVDTNLANNPVSSSANWRPATNQNQSAIAAGTVDAITAVMPIPLQALNDETMITIRASGANTTNTPTFAPDGLTAKTIVKNGNQQLVAGDIFGAGHELLLKYNSTNDVWELLNAAPKRLIILDDPVQIVTADTTEGAWTTIDMSTAYPQAATDGATAAIIRYAIVATNTGTSVGATGLLRKLGSSAGTALTQVVQCSSADTVSQALICADTAEATIPLDANSDFEWQAIKAALSIVTSDIVLVGYYA